ncbi:MAG: hypothetical protein FJZ09_06470 [Candidatus Omnitrophica bacterium]|nr:hypothetical protein [Candidatus Omnitrophota bacterium]
MRQKRILKTIPVLLLISLISSCPAFAQPQVKPEKEEKILSLPKLKKSPPSFKLSTSAGVFSGYDSNVNLSPVSKGDTFQEFLYSLSFSKPWTEGTTFTFNYDLDFLNYSRFTDSTNLLNHLRFGLHKEMGRYFDIGTGYDLGAFYYPHNKEGNFLLHRGFFYVKNYLTRRLYQEVLYESGYKRHTQRKALQDTINTYQDKKLIDRRNTGQYTIGMKVTPDLFAKVRLRFTNNDSNARFDDYYDYKAYEISPAAEYKFTRRLEGSAAFSFTRRDYKSRLVFANDYKEKDKIYAANLSFRYKVNRNNIASLAYCLRNNDSNEDLEEYTENIMTLGWQYNF